MNVSHELYDLDEASLEYLEGLMKIYSDNTYKNNIDKYNKMLDFAGQQGLTKICRDIRLCITNLSRNPYVKEYDNSEKELATDMVYIKMIIQQNSQKKDGDLL